MPSKLKNLKITKVDFVDAGANPQANILLFKNKEGKPSTISTETPEVKGDVKQENVLKRFFSVIAKAVGMETSQIDEAMEEIAKGDAISFDEKMAQANLRKTTDEIWDFCYFLQESLCSILRDNDVEVENKGPMMENSLNEFTTTVKNAISKWSLGIPTKIVKSKQPITSERLDLAFLAKQRLEDLISQSSKNSLRKAEDKELSEITKQSKGEKEDMMIDKSKLTSEEIATLEAIEKKAGIIPDQIVMEGLATGVIKSVENPVVQKEEGAEDIYKGLHPVVKAELEKLRKSAEAAEDKELSEIAKKYVIIGKKSDDLVPLFKNLKAAGGDAFDQMIAVLDASVTAVEKSGLFTEVGKKGSGSSDAWTAIEKNADTIQKSMPTLTRNQAILKACEQNPELVHEYENSK